MNIPISLIDEEGNFIRLVIGSKMLEELATKLRTEGITEVHTSLDNGSMKTYRVQGFFVAAKGSKASMMFIPEG